MKSISVFLLIVLLLTAHGLPPGGAAHAQEQSIYGLQDGWAIGDHCEVLFTEEVAAKIAESGARAVRINFRLGPNFVDWTNPSVDEECGGQSALDLYRNVIDNTYLPDGRHLEVLGLICNDAWPGGQAAWQANAAEQSEDPADNGNNAYIQAFTANVARKLIPEFADDIQYWEVWNEPNAYTEYTADGGYTGSTFIYPSNFAQLLHAVSAVCAENDVQCVSGGVFGHDMAGMETTVDSRRVIKRGNPVQPGYRVAPQAARRPQKPQPPAPIDDLSGSAYLRSTLEMGQQYVEGWTDLPVSAVGQHIYVDQGSRTSPDTIAAYLASVHAVDEMKPTAVTEIGWATDGPAAVNLRLQAKNLEAAYQTFGATPYVQGAYWFQLRDIPEANLYFGLLSRDLTTAKPAWESYQQATEN